LASGNRVAINLASNLVMGTNYVLCANNVRGTNGIPISPCIGVSMVKSNPPPPTAAVLPWGGGWFYTEPDHEISTNWRGTNYIECSAIQCVPPYDADGIWAQGASIFYYEFGTATPCPGSSFQGGPLDTGLTTYYFRARFVAPSNSTASGVL